MRAGKVVATASQKLPAGPAAQVRVPFEKFKEKLDGISVRTTLARSSADVPLGKILVVKAHETSVSASADFYAGSTAELRCAVQGVRSLPDSIPLLADVLVELAGPGDKVHPLFKGKTDAKGIAPVQFTVPEVAPGSYKLIVNTTSALGSEKLEHPIKIHS